MRTQSICVDDISPMLAASYLADELAALERARIGAGMARGSRKRTLQNYARQHAANVQLLADRVHGPIPDDIAAMSDSELLDALSEGEA